MKKEVSHSELVHIMKTKIHSVLLCVLIASSPLFADTPATTAPAHLSDADLETLVGPIALYPDALLGIMLPAAVNSTDIVLAARYLDNGGDAAQADGQPWDESVRALARYPDVLQWMDENLDWTQQLGVTFLAQEEALMLAVQRLRARANALGNLTSNEQVTVISRDNYIRIVPAQPEVIYVPYYDPQVIYVSRSYWGFGPAWVCGPWLRYDCNWLNRRIWVGTWAPRYYHRPAWGHVDRRPPAPHYVERHTWRPDHRRVSARPKPPGVRPGAIVRPSHNRPHHPPSAQRPAQHQRPNHKAPPNTNARPSTPPKSNVTRPESRPPSHRNKQHATPPQSRQQRQNTTRQQRPDSTAQPQRQTTTPRNQQRAPRYTESRRHLQQPATTTRPSRQTTPSSNRTQTTRDSRQTTTKPAQQTARPERQGTTTSRPRPEAPAQTKSSTTRSSSRSGGGGSSGNTQAKASTTSSSSSSSTSSSSSSRQASPRESRSSKPRAR